MYVKFNNSFILTHNADLFEDLHVELFIGNIGIYRDTVWEHNKGITKEKA